MAAFLRIGERILKPITETKTHKDSGNEVVTTPCDKKRPDSYSAAVLHKYLVELWVARDFFKTDPLVHERYDVKPATNACVALDNSVGFSSTCLEVSYLSAG